SAYLVNVVYDSAGLPHTRGMGFMGPVLIEFSTLRSEQAVIHEYMGEVLVRHSILVSETQACGSEPSFLSAGLNLVSDAGCGIAETYLAGVDARVERVDDGVAPPHLAILSDSPDMDAAAEDCASMEGGTVATDQRRVGRP